MGRLDPLLQGPVGVRRSPEGAHASNVDAGLRRLVSEDHLHRVYLPFSERQLRDHSAPVQGKRNEDEVDRHLGYYRRSLANLARYQSAAPDEQRRSVKRGRQVEKDERFWI